MHTFRKITHRFLAYFTALVLVAGYPLSVMAETQEATTPPVETTEQAPIPVVTEPEKPQLTYTYDPNTEKWNSEEWQFNPATNSYEKPPAPVIISPESSVDKDVDTTVNIDNNIKSDATSGNSGVTNNTSGGNATTGDAAVTANLLNVVNSSVTTGPNQKVATFTQDIMGDVKGDIVLYPMLLKAMLEAQAPGSYGSNIDVKNNFDVNNNVDLTATSGNAAVSGNTTGGDATSGNAKAVANVVNILNSMIATQDSFIGTINIYGSLEGDILIAPDFIPQMLANNKDAQGNDTKLSNESTTNIVNNISTVAESGAAAVFGNTTGGNATSGSADTGVVIFNLTGHQIVAKNSLLVFVNVLGKWVGVIVDAPEGATSALIGNEVTKNEFAPDLVVNSETNHGITNTISVEAKSGDATVSGNTTAGNATTGSAAALANIANVSNSSIGATDWFGVLFINVFQDWHGSFGINTFYGDPEVIPVQEQPSGPFQFVPQQEETTIKQARTNTLNTSGRYVASTIQTGESNTNTESIAVTEKTNDKEVAKEVLGDNTEETSAFDTGLDSRIFIIAGSILVAGLSLLGLRRLFS